jgi:hypothetical protein
MTPRNPPQVVSRLRKGSSRRGGPRTGHTPRSRADRTDQSSALTGHKPAHTLWSCVACSSLRSWRSWAGGTGACRPAPPGYCRSLPPPRPNTLPEPRTGYSSDRGGPNGSWIDGEWLAGLVNPVTSTGFLPRRSVRAALRGGVRNRSTPLPRRSLLPSLRSGRPGRAAKCPVGRAGRATIAASVPRLRRRPSAARVGAPSKPIYDYFVVVNGRRWLPKQAPALVYRPRPGGLHHAPGAPGADLPRNPMWEWITSEVSPQHRPGPDRPRLGSMPTPGSVLRHPPAVTRVSLPMAARTRSRA